MSDYTPFAQTFYVDPTISPNGIFVAAIDLAFQAVDPQLPISVQLRPTLNGYPDPSTVYPGAEVILYPESIVNLLTSGEAGDYPDFNNPSTFTRFIFPSPIYLPPGQEHAIVLKTNSSNYEVYMAIQGDFQLGTQNPVNIPPLVGASFRSTNASVWTPLPNEVLTFNIIQAIFDIADPSVVEYDNIGSSQAVNMDLFSTATSDVNYGKTTISYSFEATDVNSVVDTSPIPLIMNSNYSPLGRRVLYPNTNGSFKIFSTLTSTDPFVSPVVLPGRLSVTGIQYNINNGQLANNLLNIISSGSGYSNGTVSVTIDAPLGSGGVQATAIATVNGSGVINTLTLANLGAGYITTPNISFGGTNTSIAVAQVVGETSQSGGNALARYVCRKVTLASGMDSNDLRVFITGCIQAGTDVEVYYKVLSAQDPDQNFGDRPWVRMVQEGVPYVSQNNLDFAEYEWFPVGATLAPPSPITYSTSAGKFNTFKVFAIKICLFSSTTTTVPVLKNLRAIAIV